MKPNIGHIKYHSFSPTTAAAILPHTSVQITQPQKNGNMRPSAHLCSKSANRQPRNTSDEDL